MLARTLVLRSDPVPVREGEMSTCTIRVEAATTGSIGGLILDERTRPLRAIVQAVRPPAPPSLDNVRHASVEGAEYVIHGLLPGRWDIYAWVRSQKHHVGSVDVVAGTTIRQDIRLASGSVVVKIVDAEHGSPLRIEGRVVLTPVTAEGRVEHIAESTDEARIERLAAGRWSLQVDAKGYLLSSVATVDVVSDGTTTVTVRLSAGGTIVVRRDHLPRGCDVWLETTDGKRAREARQPSGPNLVFPGTPAGRYVVVVRDPSKRLSRTPAELLGTETCFVTAELPK
jgi:hypothetical protein